MAATPILWRVAPSQLCHARTLSAPQPILPSDLKGLKKKTWLRKRGKSHAEAFQKRWRPTDKRAKVERGQRGHPPWDGRRALGHAWGAGARNTLRPRTGAPGLRGAPPQAPHSSPSLQEEKPAVSAAWGVTRRRSRPAATSECEEPGRAKLLPEPRAPPQCHPTPQVCDPHPGCQGW